MLESKESKRTGTAPFLKAVIEELERDYLSETARKERKALLGVSLVALATSWGDLIPDKIEALGITVEELEPNKLLILLALVVIYFVGAFFLYAYGDFRDWKVRERQFAEQAQMTLGPMMNRSRELTSEDILAEGLTTSDPEIAEILGASEATRAVAKSRKIRKARLLFDIWLPLMIGALAVLFVVLDLLGIEDTIDTWTQAHPWVTAVMLLALLGASVLSARWLSRRSSQLAGKATAMSGDMRAMSNTIKEMQKHGKDTRKGKMLKKKLDRQLKRMSANRKK